MGLREGQSGPRWKSLLLSSAVRLPGHQAVRSRRQWRTEARTCTEGHRAHGEMSQGFHCCCAPLSPKGLVLAGKHTGQVCRLRPSAPASTQRARTHCIGSHSALLGSGGQRKPYRAE